MRCICKKRKRIDLNCIMKPYRIIVALFSFLQIGLSFGCSSPKSNPEDITQKTIAAKPVDTANSFKVQGTWITLMPKFEFNSLDRFSNDTLSLAICGNYVYSPFGTIDDSLKIQKSSLSNFEKTNRVDTSTPDRMIVQSLKFKSSKLLLFFDKDPEASTHSYVIKGEIYDPEVRFSDGIRVGMAKTAFFKTFFSNFPETISKQTNVFCLESCIMGIRHIYTFTDDKLTSVRFECVDCTWKVDY